MRAQKNTLIFVKVLQFTLRQILSFHQRRPVKPAIGTGFSRAFPLGELRCTLTRPAARLLQVAQVASEVVATLADSGNRDIFFVGAWAMILDCLPQMFVVSRIASVELRAPPGKLLVVLKPARYTLPARTDLFN